MNFVSTVASQVKAKVLPAHTSPIARLETLSSAVAVILDNVIFEILIKRRLN